MVKTIEREDLRQSLQRADKPLLIEALPAGYYRPEHIPGAVNINYDEIETALDRLPADRSRPIVTYCASDTCQNSHKAAEALARLGYSDVAVYVGGKKDWKAAGLPLVAARERTPA